MTHLQSYKMELFGNMNVSRLICLEYLDRNRLPCHRVGYLLDLKVANCSPKKGI